MTSAPPTPKGAALAPGLRRPPDHTQLPYKDNLPVRNSQEPPQSTLLTDSLEPVLRQRHPDGAYYIGEDVGIYWLWTEPELRGAKSPDWYYVPGVPHLLNGEMRNSYVLWHEGIPPLIVLEYATRGTAEEHDQTPWEGKFWVYERIIRPAYYGIFDLDQGRLEVYSLVSGHYQLMAPTEQGRYPMPELGVELGLWQGRFREYDALWLRWWDERGNLLPHPCELVDQERLAREQAQQHADQERQAREQAEQQADQAKLQAEWERQAKEQAQQRAERLAERLRALGVDPEQS